MGQRRAIHLLSSRSRLLGERRKATAHAAETNWERTVASAAPRTPMSKTKMNSGSSRMLSTAPIRTVHIPMRAKPCALMKLFIPSPSMTKTLPHR